MNLFVLIKKICILASLLVLLPVNPCAAEEQEKPGEYVATVNDVGISRKDFDRSVANAKKQFSRLAVPRDSDQGKKVPADIQKEVLNRLIDFELMYQDSAGRPIIVEDILLERDLKEFKKRFKEKGDFTSFLKENNISEDDLKLQFKKQRTIQDLQNILRHEMTAQIKVNDADIKTFYEKNLDKFQRPEQIRARHILVSVKKTADETEKKEARAKIEEIQKQLKDGKDFAELARAESQCQSRERGGDLGFFARGQMVAPFDKTAFSLKPDEISDIVETQYGYHLIKMEEKRAAGPVDFEDVKEKIKHYLSQVQLEKLQREYMEGLRGKAKIIRMLKID
jgi:peptidyl-prolyl cis-trans isomerase C